MTIFTIDAKNNITSYGSQSEISDKDAAPFTSEKELAHLASDWPGTRVVDVWNGISGVTPVKRFTNRPVAIARIWKAIQPLAPAEEKRTVASKPGRAARKPRRKQHAQTAGKNTKQAGYRPAEKLQWRHSDSPHAPNRLAGAQRPRLYLRSPWQKAGPRCRVLQECSRRASVSYTVNHSRTRRNSAGGTCPGAVVVMRPSDDHILRRRPPLWRSTKLKW